MKLSDVTASDVGKYCNKDNQWAIRDLKDLKVWQLEQIKKAIKSGINK